MTHIIRGIDIAAGVEERPYEFGVPVDGGLVEGGAPRVVSRLPGRAARYQETSDAAVAALARHMQGCTTYLILQSILIFCLFLAHVIRPTRSRRVKFDSMFETISIRTPF